MHKLWIFLIFFIFTVNVTAIDVSVCGTSLNSDNTIYDLTADVNSAGTCFSLSGTNVTLDCNGYQINFSQSVAGYGVQMVFGSTDLEVRNCNIVSGGDFTPIGIETSGTNPYVHHTNITMAGTGVVGIRMRSQGGIVLFHDNQVHTIGESARSIWLGGSTHLYNNNASVYGCNGVWAAIDEYVDISSTHEIHDNYFATYSDCLGGASRSWGTAIPHNSIVYNNTFYGWGSPGTDTLVTVDMSDAQNTQVFENIFHTEGQSTRSIYFSGVSANNTLHHNTFNSYAIGNSPMIRIRATLDLTIHDNNMNGSARGIMNGDSYNQYASVELFNNTIRATNPIYYYGPSVGYLHAYSNILIPTQYGIYNDLDDQPHNITDTAIVQCTSGCLTPYAAFGTRADNPVTGEHVFTNVSFNKSSTMIYQSNILRVRWYLDVHVQDDIFQPIVGQSVTIENPGGVVFVGDTDANGNVRVAVSEYTENSGGQTNLGPYNVSITGQYQDNLPMADNTNVVFTVSSGNCTLRYNNDPCATISSTELSNVISGWYQSSAGMSELLSHIKAWKSGTGY